MLRIEKCEDTGWINITSILRYRVINNIVYVQVFNAGTIQLKVGDNFLGSLPTEYKPTREVILPIQFMGGADKTINPLVHSRIDTNGNINVYLLEATKHIEGFISYPV